MYFSELTPLGALLQTPDPVCEMLTMVTEIRGITAPVRGC